MGYSFYEMQLMLLEQRKQENSLMARQERDRTHVGQVVNAREFKGQTNIIKTEQVSSSGDAIPLLRSQGDSSGA